MELPGVAPAGFARFRPRLALLGALSCLVAAALAAALAPSARAATHTRIVGTVVTHTVTVVASSAPQLVTELNHPPPGYRLTALQVERIAARNPTSIAELRRHPDLKAYEYTKGPGQWQVSWFQPGPAGRELLQVYVDDASGQVTQAWTGYQVAWTMARGYPGAFGRRVNALYVWLPLCAVFLLPFLPWRRPRRFTLWHLDLLVLLAFSISLAFFNHGRIGLSIPLPYPFLVYLLVRVLLLAFGRGIPSAPLRAAVPISWLAIGVVFLVGFRIGLNVTNSNVIDVGYAGVIGAHKILHGEPLYGQFPSDNVTGDTYGPVNYLAYVPATAIFGWSGTWDQLPAAHATSIAFDLLTLIGLFFLGRMIRGPSTGVLLAYLWAAYPFTLYSLASNTNDSLIALLIVLALLVLRWAPARGAAIALAGAAKFAPFVLGPLFARGTGPWRWRSIFATALGAAVTVALVMIPVLSHNSLHLFWHRTFVSQFDRTSPFSIWGLWGGLNLEQRALEVLTVLLAVLVMFVPARRTVVEVAALAAALVIALELCLTHWFYLYIPWFFAPLAVALVCAHPSEIGHALALDDASDRSAPAELAAA